VEELTNLDSYSTMGEVKAAANMARHPFDAIEQSNAEVKNAQVDALRNTYEDLQVAIAALPDDATGGCEGFSSTPDSSGAGR
jgi:hypothetical protein